jgi:hypothetical protein
VKGLEEEKALDLRRDGQSFQAVDRDGSETPDASVPDPSDKRAGARTALLPSYTEGESQNSIIQQKMRRCMRRVPQSAVIVTATNINDSRNPSRGATVSSFTTVTFEPEVIVSLNLKLPSATFDAIQASNWFGVKMLKPNHIGAAAASRFAKGHRVSPFGEAGRGGPIAANRSPKRHQQSAPPLLHEGHGIKNPVAFHLTCLYMREKSVYLGDHVVMFGTVKRIPETTDKHLEGESCLAYVDGCYGSVKPFSRQPQETSDEFGVRRTHALLSPFAEKPTVCDEVAKGDEKQKHGIENNHDIFALLQDSVRGNVANERVPPQEDTNRPSDNLSSSFVERPERPADNDNPYLPLGGSDKSSTNRHELTKPTSPKIGTEYRLERTHSVQEADPENGTITKFRAQSSPSTSTLVSTLTMPSAPVPVVPFRGFATTRRFSQSTMGMRYREGYRSSKNTGSKLLLATGSRILQPAALRATRKYSAGGLASVGLTTSADGAAVDQNAVTRHLGNAGKKGVGPKFRSENQSREEEGYPLSRPVYRIIKTVASDDHQRHKMILRDRHTAADGAKIRPLFRTQFHDVLPIRKSVVGDLVVRYTPRDDVGVRKFAYENENSPELDSNGRQKTVDAANEHASIEPKRQDTVSVRKLYATDNRPPPRFPRRKNRTRRGRHYHRRERAPLSGSPFLPSNPGRYQARIGDKNTTTLTNDASALIDAILQGLDSRIRKQPSYFKPGKQLVRSIPSKELRQARRQIGRGTMRKVAIGPQNKNEVSLLQLSTTEAMRHDIEDVKNQIQELFFKK